MTSNWIPRILCRVIIIVVLALFAEVTLHRHEALAQATPFLTSPYYGNAAIAQGWSSSFEPNHHAYDFGLNYRQVLAAETGTVAAVQWYNNVCHSYNGSDSTTGLQCGFGLFIRIDHNSNGYSTYYVHLSSAAFALTTGGTTTVESGQIIGTSGATGWTV